MFVIKLAFPSFESYEVRVNRPINCKVTQVSDLDFEVEFIV